MFDVDQQSAHAQIFLRLGVGVCHFLEEHVLVVDEKYIVRGGEQSVRRGVSRRQGVPMLGYRIFSIGQLYPHLFSLYLV